MKNVYLAKEEMPAYKVANMGVENMTNVELLSLLIGGTAEKAMDTARNLLAMCDGKLANMARLQPKMMAECEGLERQRLTLSWQRWNLEDVDRQNNKTEITSWTVLA